MAKSFKSSKAKRDGQGFVALPHVVLESPSYRALSHAARSLLIDIAKQYTGTNNGRLVACTKYLKPLGWKSHDTVARALADLKAAGFLIETRMGMRPNRAAWFALGWYALDDSKGMDIDPKTYRTGQYKNAPLIPSGGIERTRIAPPQGVRALTVAPSHGAMQ
jgi:hypothetical protein